MSRRSLFSNRNVLSRRVMDMMASLFRRRFQATMHSLRRSRLGRRLREFGEDLRSATTASTKLVNTHLLTVSQAEPLEPRMVMSVNAYYNAPSGDLFVWMDSASDKAYIQQLSASQLQVSSTPGFQIGTINYTGTVPTTIRVYDAPTVAGGTLTGNLQVSNHGSGYTTWQTLNIEDTSAVTSLKANVGLTLDPAHGGGAPTFTAGSGFINGTQTLTVTDGQGGTATYSATITANAINLTQPINYQSGNGNFHSLTGLTVTGSGGGTATITAATGGLGNIIYQNATQAGAVGVYDYGYWAVPYITVPSAGGGVNGAVTVTGPANTAILTDYASTGVVISELAATPLTSFLRLGDERNANLDPNSLGDIETLDVRTSLGNGIFGVALDSINITSDISAGANPVNLSLSGLGSGLVSNASITASSILIDTTPVYANATGGTNTLLGSGGTVTLTGGLLKATAGDVTIDSD